LRRVLLLCAFVLWAGQALGAVSARFDRTQVYEGDTVALIIEAEGLGAAAPDLTALESDFELLGTATSNRIEIINGRRSDTRAWQITLAPRRLGIIEVPPIAVGNEQTPSLRLEVAEAQRGAEGAGSDELFLELELGGDGGPVMVQQQVPMTVRLFTTLPLRVGALGEPKPDGAVLERLGEDTQYETTRNGVRYQVIERRFSLSPERSGELRIPPVTFNGELRTGSGGRAGRDPLGELFRDPVFERFGSGLFERGRPVRARSEAATLEVRPQPEGFSGDHWLPAEAVAIEDDWADDAVLMTSGEPSTRTLTVTATGLAGSQIPVLDVPVPDGVRAYAEAVETETRTDGKRLFGVSRQRVTLLPAAEGRLQFPEVRLPWWDVNEGRERVARLPARPVVVGAAQGTDPARVASDANTRLSDTAVNGDAAAAAEAGAASGPQRLETRRRPVLWVLAAALALVLLLWLRGRQLRLRQGLRRWWSRRTTAGPVRATMAAAKRVLPAALANRASVARRDDPLAAVRAACSSQDAGAAAAALLALARRLWGEAAPTSLGGLAARLEQPGGEACSRAAAAVRALESALYGPAGGGSSATAPWQGEALAQALPAALAAVGSGPAQQEGDSALPLAPLYPQRNR
jgi:hypothetical protein